MKEAHGQKIQGRPCRMCGAPYPELHHLLHRGRMSKKNPERGHPDNAIPLCHVCHQNHHTAVKKVPRVLLMSQELEFMKRHIHPGWIDTWYPEGD